MATDIKIIDPYDSYEPYVQEDAGTYGEDFLESVAALQVGFGSQVLRIDQDGLWLGAEDFASAPFKVDMAGNMTATTLDLSSYLQVGDALADIQSDIFDLSDIDADLGVITAGTLIGLTITGGLIRTSSSGGRVEIDGSTDNIEIYDTGGTKRMELDNDELTFYNSSGTRIGYITTPTTTSMFVGAPTGNYLILEAEGTAPSSAVIIRAAGVQSMAFSTAGITVSDDMTFNNNDLLLCGNITANDTTSDIGTSGTPFDNLHIADIYFASQTSNPSTDGQARYYDSGTEGLRMQFGGSDFQFDASAA